MFEVYTGYSLSEWSNPIKSTPLGRREKQVQYMEAGFRGLSVERGFLDSSLSNDNVLKRNYDYPLGIVWGQG